MISSLIGSLLAGKAHVAALAVASAMISMRAVGAPVPVRAWFVTLFIIWGVYLDNLITDREEDRANGLPDASVPPRFPFERLYPVFYLAALVLAFAIGPTCGMYAAIATALFIAYGHAAPGLFRERLKKFFIVKNVVPAAAWTLAVCAVPFVSSGVAFVPLHGLLLAAVFLFCVREEIKFDIPDVDGDRQAGIRTLPNTGGEARTREVLGVLSYVLTFLFVLALWTARKPGSPVFFGTLFLYAVPGVFTFLYDGEFIDLLFRRRKKILLNAGAACGALLLALFLVVPAPANVVLFVGLGAARNLVLRSL